VVNPGSVGMPYGHGGAAWALLGPRVELRRTYYDPAAAATRLANSSWPRAAWWAETFVLQQASDTEALAVFTQSRGTSSRPQRSRVTAEHTSNSFGSQLTDHTN
jgi:hypothetical protein